MEQSSSESVPVHKPFFTIEGVTFSADTAKLDKAMAIAFGKTDNAKKGSENPAFKKDGKNSKYADISANLDACRESLSSSGVSVSQWVNTNEDFSRVRVTTRFACEGQFIMSTIVVPTAKRDAHGVIAASTYGRRAALAAAAGIAAEDDDGNSAAGVNPEGGKKEASPPKPATKAPLKNFAKPPEPPPPFEDMPQDFPPDDMPPSLEEDFPGAFNAPPEPPQASKHVTRAQAGSNLVAAFNSKFILEAEQRDILQRVTSKSRVNQLTTEEMVKVREYVEKLTANPDPKKVT